MTQELEVKREGAVVVDMPAQSQSNQFLATIHQAASDPSVDMDKMDRLYAMYKDVKSEEGRVEYNRAMSACQAEMPAIEKRHYNEQTSSYFAKIEDIIRQIKPIWTKHGFSLSLYPGQNAPEGFIKVCCDVSHAAGDTRHFEYDSPIDDKGIKGTVNKTQTHGRASGITYGERYLIGLIFALEVGLSGQDDDGNAAGVELVTDEQALALEAFIKDNDLDEDAFLNYIESKTKNRDYHSIPAAAYDGIMKQAKAKAEKGKDNG